MGDGGGRSRWRGGDGTGDTEGSVPCALDIGEALWMSISRPMREIRTVMTDMPVMIICGKNPMESDRNLVSEAILVPVGLNIPIKTPVKHKGE